MFIRFLCRTVPQFWPAPKFGFTPVEPWSWSRRHCQAAPPGPSLRQALKFRRREEHMDTLSHTAFTRRSVLRSAAGAGLAAAPAPPLPLLAGPAKASTYRGVVGDIKPRAADSSLVDMIKLLPEGIGVIPVYLNLTQGSRDEYGSSYATHQNHIAYLASQSCNVLAIEGAPPFMLLGPAREAEMVDGWKRKYNTDMFTSSQNQVNAFRALKAKRILGITSGSGRPEMNKV